ncbi:hypothetical protein EHS39_08695 [Ensifer sp. MPMI2T]|nr:hypothetical protein EHS39_08695 [Ensifer sp. MPMI2T]
MIAWADRYNSTNFGVMRLQRHASYQTRRGRRSTLNSCTFSSNRLHAAVPCNGGGECCRGAGDHAAAVGIDQAGLIIVSGRTIASNSSLVT